MTTSLIFLTPLLVLLIVVLFGFVGCNWFFGLDETTLVEPGPGPANFVAEAGDNQVALSWDVFPNAIQYDLTRRDSADAFSTTVTIPASSLDPNNLRVSYTDKGAVNGVTYFYSVRATDSQIESNPSEEREATPSAASRIAFVSSFMGLTSVNGAPSGMYGMAVDVGTAPIIVKSLGRASVPGPAMEPNTQTHIVKIVDMAGADVPGATTTVNMLGVPAGTFQYTALLPPVTLAANTRYYIVSQEVLGQDYFFNHDMTIMVKDVAKVPTSVRGGPPYVEDNTTLHSYGPVSFQY